MEEITKDLLKTFQERSEEYPGDIPYSVSFNNKKSSSSLFICAAIHGDEVGSIPALLRIIDEFKNKTLEFDGKITFALGNIEAIKINKRFVKEDMNRIFGKGGDSVDAKRATEIAKLVTSHKIFIDLHQTISPTKCPFFVIRGSPLNLALARITQAAPLAILVDNEEMNNHSRVTGTAFAAKHDVTAFTLELSQKGYNIKAEELAFQTIKKIITVVNKNPTSDWVRLSETNPKLSVVTIDYAHEFTDPSMRLVPGLINGEFYKKGTVLGEYRDHKILAPFDGYIFFPKYPERDKHQNANLPLPSHLFEFGKLVN